MINNCKNHTSTGGSERGATFVELALATPAFAAGILFFIWLGVFLHSSTALEAALSRALRLAATRGADELVGVKVIDDIQQYVNGTTTARMPKLLANGVPFLDAEAYYDARAVGTFAEYDSDGDGAADTAVSSLKDLPPEYTYALVYLHESIKQAIGPGVRYPCDPNDLINGSGCVGCSFLTPNTLQPSFTGPNQYEDPPGVPQPPPRREIGLECRYQPSTVILTPLVRLVSLIHGSGEMPLLVTSKRQFLDIPRF